MKNKIPKLILFCLLFASQVYSQQEPQHSKKVVGYYAQWAIYARNYGVHQIEADKLTHLMYAFYNTIYDSDTQTTRLESLDPHADFAHNNFNITYPSGTNTETERGNFGQLKMLKEKYPHLKILISLGGWTRSQHFPALSASEKGRLTLAQSMVDLMQKYPWIGGFDIDWEFPVIGGIVGESVGGNPVPDQPSTPDDHKNLVFLLKKIREVFDANGMQDKELSIAAGNNVSRLLEGHVGPGNQASHGMTENIFDFCDFVTFFGYDFGGNWFEKACYNAPLYGGDHPNDPLNRGAGNPNQILDDLVTLYLSENGLKAPSEKLIMGIPFYGKLFERVESTGIIPELPGLYEKAPNETTSFCSNRRPPQGSWDDPMYPCEQSGSIEFGDLFQGNATNKHQYLDQTGLAVSSAAAADGWKRYWDDTAKVPYLYNANDSKFISYDDPQSIDLKVKYALSKQMGGVMIWELSQDARNSNLGLLDVIDNSILEADYSITLNFKANMTPLESVVVELKDENGTVLKTLNSDSNGQVVFSDVKAFLPYVIDYSYSNYSFAPRSINFKALEFDSDKVIDVTASNQVSQIQGTVKENGVLLTDVNVVLKGSNDQELESIPSTDGHFTFAAVINGLDYSLTAEKDYYSFTNLTYTNLSTDQINQEIIATRNTHTISGEITSGSDPLDGVIVTVSGNGQNYTNTTDTNGNYLIENIPAGYDYTVTPTKDGVTFKPLVAKANLLNENKTFNFAENIGIIYGSVKNGSTPVSGAVVSLILPYIDATYGYQNILKTTNAQGEYFYTETELNGYNTISSLKLEIWQNNSVTYYPTDLTNIAITTTPQEYNFNSQFVTPQVTINRPNQADVSLNYGAAVDLEALVELGFDDGSTTISSVTFDIDGTTINHSKTGNTYTGSWAPLDSDYGTTHTFKVSAEASNNQSVEETYNFTLKCTGSNCPNVAPHIVWNSPNNTTINQNNGFENIPISVTATDSDGTVSSVTITIDGATNNMTAGANNTYSYDFTPSDHIDYPVVIDATDNENETTTYTSTLSIINSQFVPLPSGNIILGYAHSWESADAPFLYFNQMLDTKFNVVMYSFIETEADGFTPKLTINSNRYLTGSVFDKQLLIDDINSLRSQGIPVIVSIGGANGHVELKTVAEKNTFVQGVKDIVDTYGFDGVDIDFEGASMNFGAGALSDFSYATISSSTDYSRLKNVIDAFKELKQDYGPNFIMTCAPETAYVQTGYNTFLDDRGSFLAVLHNLRNELDLVMVQLYNSGTQFGLDNNLYTQGTPDFLVAMTDMLLTDFKTAGPGINFPALPASKIMVAIPACNKAAQEASYIEPTETIKALDYLRFGTNFSGRNYSLQNGTHPDLRGVMTWSVNWDAAANCASEYEFSTSYFNYFNDTASIDESTFNNEIKLYPNPVENQLTIKSKHAVRALKIYNVLGKEIHFTPDPAEIFDTSFLSNGVYFIQFQTDLGKVHRRLIKK